MTGARIVVRTDSSRKSADIARRLGPAVPLHGDARIVLLVDEREPPPVDGGLPDDFARVLARGLVRIARVTFPTSSHARASAETWSPVGEDGDPLVCRAAGERTIDRIGDRLRRRPRGTTLMSTRRAERVATLFDDPGYPWWLQGQIAILTAIEQPPPRIERARFERMYGFDWARVAAELGALGVVRPAIDGAGAALATWSPAFEAAALAAIEAEASAAGCGWTVIAEGAGSG